MYAGSSKILYIGVFVSDLYDSSFITTYSVPHTLVFLVASYFLSSNHSLVASGSIKISCGIGFLPCFTVSKSNTLLHFFSLNTSTCQYCSANSGVVAKYFHVTYVKFGLFPPHVPLYNFNDSFVSKELASIFLGFTLNSCSTVVGVPAFIGVGHFLFTSFHIYDIGSVYAGAVDGIPLFISLDISDVREYNSGVSLKLVSNSCFDVKFFANSFSFHSDVSGFTGAVGCCSFASISAIISVISLVFCSNPLVSKFLWMILSTSAL